jgi:hypothetical protein
MGTPSYMWFVVDRNVVMGRMTVYRFVLNVKNFMGVRDNSRNVAMFIVVDKQYFVNSYLITYLQN